MLFKIIVVIQDEDDRKTKILIMKNNKTIEDFRNLPGDNYSDYDCFRLKDDLDLSFPKRNREYHDFYIDDHIYWILSAITNESEILSYLTDVQFQCYGK